MTWKHHLGLHSWIETDRDWNGLWDNVDYICSECGTKRRYAERPHRGDLSEDPSVRARQKAQREADRLKALAAQEEPTDD